MSSGGGSLAVWKNSIRLLRLPYVHSRAGPKRRRFRVKQPHAKVFPLCDLLRHLGRGDIQTVPWNPSCTLDQGRCSISPFQEGAAKCFSLGLIRYTRYDTAQIGFSNSCDSIRNSPSRQRCRSLRPD